MRVLVNGVQLFFDVQGASLVPAGPSMREKPTLLLLHCGPGFDHSIYKPAYSTLADCAQVISYGQKIGSAEEPVLHRAIAVAGGPELGRWEASWLPRLRRLPRSPNRSAHGPGLNLGRAITPPLDGNSAGAHPIAPGIEQTAARGGYPYHEGTAGRYPLPW